MQNGKTYEHQSLDGKTRLRAVIGRYLTTGVYHPGDAEDVHEDKPGVQDFSPESAAAALAGTDELPETPPEAAEDETNGAPANWPDCHRKVEIGFSTKGNVVFRRVFYGDTKVCILQSFENLDDARKALTSAREDTRAAKALDEMDAETLTFAKPEPAKEVTSV